MSEETHPAQSPPLKDRTTGLIIFGVIHLCLGALASLATLAMSFTLLAAGALGDEMAESDMNAKMLFPILLIYVAIAVWFVTMGIGSLLKRRWARALILVSSWCWIIAGIGGAIMMAFMFGNMLDQMGQNQDIPAGYAAGFMTIVFGFIFTIYIAAPGTLILFYRSPHVKATCEFRNPAPSWTDACPLPVLAQVMVFCSWAMMVPAMGAYNWIFPFFGTVLSGAAGAAAALLFGAVGLVLMWGSYKLKPVAWWGAIAAFFIVGLSSVLTYARVDMMEFYEKMGYTEEQLTMMRQFSDMQDSAFYPVMGTMVGVVAMLGLLLYNRRYFSGSGGTQNTSAPAPVD